MLFHVPCSRSSFRFSELPVRIFASLLFIVVPAAAGAGGLFVTGFQESLSVLNSIPLPVLQISSPALWGVF